MEREKLEKKRDVGEIEKEIKDEEADVEIEKEK